MIIISWHSLLHSLRSLCSFMLAMHLSSITEIAIHVLVSNNMFSRFRVHSNVQIVRDPALHEFL